MCIKIAMNHLFLYWVKHETSYLIKYYSASEQLVHNICKTIITWNFTLYNYFTISSNFVIKHRWDKNCASFPDLSIIWNHMENSWDCHLQFVNNMLNLRIATWPRLYIWSWWSCTSLVLKMSRYGWSWQSYTLKSKFPISGMKS